MDAKQHDLFKRQEIIAEGIRKIGVNFGKDGPDRKTTSYVKVRLDNLQAQWNEFEMNNSVLQSAEDQTASYYTTKAYERVKAEYLHILQKLQAWPTYSASERDSDPIGNQGESSKNMGVLSRSDELKTQQSTNFRAFSRFTRNLNVADTNEKWDIEDKLKVLESRWKVIDEAHWKLDNLLVGSDVNYELEFSKYEETYESAKRELNRKLNQVIQQRDSAPKIDIPTFSGNYSQWPTFLDLYSAAIHNNPNFSKGKKMQHLKGKLKGEAERLVQHLSVCESNYDSCWEILHHRYNNRQLLFTKQMHTLMSQQTLQHQNAYELKRLHDTSLETVHGLRNLGIDTTTWDPILVHILVGKLDPQTFSDYMEARKNPRELPVFDEFIGFIEGKFTALESVVKKRSPTSSKPAHTTFSPLNKEGSAITSQKDAYNKYKRYSKANHISSNRNCPICKTNHILLSCKTFQEMSPEAKLKTMEQMDICKNCMYSHNGNKCNSVKRCRVCNNSHHTVLHDVTRDTTITRSSTGHRPSNTCDKQPHAHGNTNHVSGKYNEVMLSTVQLKVRAVNGEYTTLRCLLDQGSQLNLITESAVQRLGLPRRNLNSTVSGIGSSATQSNGTVELHCESRFGDYQFTTQALVMPKLLNNLPNYSFEKQDWPHIQNINLADPQYNLSRSIDILLDAGVYADIIMSNILRGHIHAPIAQQTKLGWILVGNTNTFNCHVVVNNNDFSRFWEMEELLSSSHNESLTVEEEYCESLYVNTTTRLEDGRYEVRIPMKTNFKQSLGQSKPQAIAQLKQLEKRLNRDVLFASNYKAFIYEYLSLQHMKPCTIPTAPSCFLPHHGVLKPDSTTTKLRVVFNASATTSSGSSLNELMCCGPNLQQDIQAMILRWRTFKYVYTADIEKFYRQIRIHEKDQHLQKIVWRNSISEPIQEYQLTTVTYGTKSAPYLAMRTVKQLIQDDGAFYPLAADILSNQLYMDDVLGGSHDLITAQKAQDEIMTLLRGGGFNLRWDTLLPLNLQQEWEHFRQEMTHIHAITVSRWIGNTLRPYELHGFCDASEKAFTSSAYKQGHGSDEYATKRYTLLDRLNGGSWVAM
ncbi:uncharacterized protein LOC142985815 [Anticarsia gemmatalis]|uniref:uncharacterized protein LOC142985815 n=1 Tax=Anticarsia gemmatalis TaxID=129554 RepID=UPI003F773F20